MTADNIFPPSGFHDPLFGRVRLACPEGNTKLKAHIFETIMNVVESLEERMKTQVEELKRDYPGQVVELEHRVGTNVVSQWVARVGYVFYGFADTLDGAIEGVRKDAGPPQGVNDKQIKELRERITDAKSALAALGISDADECSTVQRCASESCNCGAN